MQAKLIRSLSLFCVLALGACDCKDAPGSGDAAVGDARPDVPFLVTCGNSVIDANETCDDGNANVNDGCSSVCVVEQGWTCPTLGQACVGCGDGIIQVGEFCDDHNRADGDGCSMLCQREPGWDCVAEVCTPSACGDGHKVGPEDCDDGNRVSGDGCSIRCSVENGWVCVTENYPCRMAVCGDGSIEAQEQCDDLNNAAPGCSATCQLETGYACPTPGQACVATSCGDGVMAGLEACDDGDQPPAAGDGCDASCQLETGFSCPTPGQACVASACGNGVREGLEACDDHNTTASDGCSATCAVEAFYECTGAPQSVCTKPIEFVRIAKFAAPMQQPQAVHYDPRTRSFVAYDFSTAVGTDDAQEFCLDGTTTNVRDTALEARRELVGASLDGAGYDPFRDTFLFVRQDGRLFEIDRNNTVLNAGGTVMMGLGTAGGVQVGDDARIYATNHYANAHGMIYEFVRNTNGSFNTTSVGSITPASLGTYLDNIFNIPGLQWMGFYNLPNPALPSGQRGFVFHRYDGSLVGISDIPGVLFRNGEHFPKNADGGEAAIDGGYFLVCSEYLVDPDNSVGPGICQLFAQTCVSSLDCAERVPGTVCKLDEAIPYCYAPAVARDDRFVVPRDTQVDLDVLQNDAFADAVCAGAAPMITAVTPGNMGGTITIAGGGTRVHYVAPSGVCGFIETFTYTANLGGSVVDTASVAVTVPCVCGNSVVEAGEQCDDGNTTAGDDCSPTCQTESSCGNNVVEAGEQCDDGNHIPADGCSPTCLFQFE